MACSRGAFCSGQVQDEIASSTSSIGASRTPSQDENFSRSCRKARALSRFFVRWERRDETSSLSGSRSWKYGIGHPYSRHSLS
jgi:hypothetical protein